MPFVASLDCAALPKVERLPLPVDENLMFASDTVQQLVRELTFTDELIELVQDLWPTENGLASLRIGGYTKRIGGKYSPEEQMARASLRARLATGPDLARPERIRWRREEESRLIREWVPLAQFPTESFCHFGRFLIRFDDLAAGRFDQMRSFPAFTE
ncbi:hypothetical protein [Micromonospora sp. DT63]|uniref:hypothetical protein n=1 Tax=Micromonospora sp. DT63 TaxID=3393441 RepID=UPI003CE6B0FF